jgi:hypothetical protein
MTANPKIVCHKCWKREPRAGAPSLCNECESDRRMDAALRWCERACFAGALALFVAVWAGVVVWSVYRTWGLM